MRKNLLLSIAVLIGVVWSSAIAQQSVQLTVERGNFVPYHPYNLIFGSQIVFTLRVVNNSPEACSYAPSFGWHVYSPDGAQWSNLQLTATPEYDCPTMEYYSGGVPGMGDDTVGAVCLDGVIIDGYDETAFRLSLQLSYDWQNNGKMICIDTVGYGGPSGFQWVWGGQECPDVIPSWLCLDGIPAPTYGVCFQITSLPDCCQTIFPTPDSIVGSHCEPMSMQFLSESVMGDQVIYDLFSGPGSMDSVTGLWTWDNPSLEDVGKTIWVEVGSHNTWLQEVRHSMRVVVTNEAPEFVLFHDLFLVGCEGPWLPAAYSASSECPNDPREFFVEDDGGLLGDCSFTDSVLYYTYDYRDAGWHDLILGVTDGSDTSLRPAWLVLAACGTCCGVYTGGYTGNCDCDPEGIRNLIDVTRLIDYIYLSREPLCCEGNGNVDGDAENKINLTDVTRLIDYIYLSKDETAICQ